MKLFERIAFGLGLMVVGVTVVYRYVLTDEQRAAMQEAKGFVTSATREISDTVTPLYSSGPTKSEEEAAIRANRSRTEAQWEALGY